MRSAARALGWPENSYKSHEQGERGKDGLKEADIKKYARAFGVSAAWLFLGHGSPKLTPDDAEWAEMTAEERALAIRLFKVVAEEGAPAGRQSSP